MTVALFSYGTLQQPEVQIATFGRRLEGRPDTLAGYALRPLAITDPAVVATSGSAVHAIACRTGRPDHIVAWVVFLLTEAELDAADRYETDAYARVEATLGSGASAYVYVGPDLAD